LGVAHDELPRTEWGAGIMKLRIRRIEKAQDFVALAPIWAQLAKESGQLSPFLSYDWFWCCWHGVWPQCDPEILVIEESAGPVAVVPLMHWREWVHGLPVRSLGFLECPSTPWADILTVDRHNRVIEALLDHLVARSDWDMVWLQKLPVTSPTLKTLEEILPGRISWHRTGHLACPFVKIDGDWEHFCRTMNASYADTHRPIDAQLQRGGDLRLEEHRLIDLQGPLLQETFAVLNLQTQRGHVIAAMPRQREFFHALTQRAAKNGWLSLWTLKLDSQVIAVQYQLRANGKVQTLWADDDPRYRDLSPDCTLHQAILRSLFECGDVDEYSTGPGVKNAQLWWATGHHKAVHLKLYRPSLYARLLYRLGTNGVQGVSR
jgi:CelD/BcsL family acetyltransferase involved in cellulose biosynthesis